MITPEHVLDELVEPIDKIGEMYFRKAFEHMVLNYPGMELPALATAGFILAVSVCANAIACLLETTHVNKDKEQLFEILVNTVKSRLKQDKDTMQ